MYCNGVTRYGNRKSPSIGEYSNIVYDCDWIIRFKYLNSKEYTLSDSVEIVQVCGLYANTSDSLFVDQYVVVRTKAGEYKNDV